MKVKEAITRADRLRPNAIEEDLKYSWLFELEGRVAEMLGVDVPENTFPMDAKLLMPAPYEGIYERYLCAMIDNALQDTAMYANDLEVFNAFMADAEAYYRRHTVPAKGKYWRVW